MSSDIQWKSVDQMYRDVRELVRDQYGEHIPDERLQREIPITLHSSPQEWKNARERYVEQKVQWYLEEYPPGSAGYDQLVGEAGATIDESVPEGRRSRARQRQQAAVEEYLRDQFRLRLDEMALTLGGFYNPYEDRIEVRYPNPKLIAHEYIHALSYRQTRHGMVCDFDEVVDHAITESLTELYTLEIVRVYAKEKLWNSGNTWELAPSFAEFYSREPARQLIERTSRTEVANAYFSGRATRRVRKAGAELSAPFDRPEEPTPLPPLNRAHPPRTPPSDMLDRIKRRITELSGRRTTAGDRFERSAVADRRTSTRARRSADGLTGGTRLQRPPANRRTDWMRGQDSWQYHRSSGQTRSDQLASQQLSRDRIKRQESMARRASRRPTIQSGSPSLSSFAERMSSSMRNRTQTPIPMHESTLHRTTHRSERPDVSPYVHDRSKYRPVDGRRNALDHERHRPSRRDAPGKLSRYRPPPVLHSDPLPAEITVKPGDTLWDISERLTGSGHNCTQLYRANQDRIAHPDWIFPNDRLRIPTTWYAPPKLGGRRP